MNLRGTGGQESMADMADLEGQLASADAAAIYEEDGGFKSHFLDEVKTAVEAGDAARLVSLAGGLHEAALGALLAALDPDQRSKLVELMGRDFDFAALTEIDAHIRDEILEELPTET